MILKIVFKYSDAIAAGLTIRNLRPATGVQIYIERKEEYVSAGYLEFISKVQSYGKLPGRVIGFHLNISKNDQGVKVIKVLVPKGFNLESQITTFLDENKISWSVKQ